jgi:hypothetical protein
MIDIIERSARHQTGAVHTLTLAGIDNAGISLLPAYDGLYKDRGQAE